MRRHRTLIVAAATLSAALWALSCGDGATEPPPDPPRPTMVRVTPATAELTALGATVQLNAQVLDQYGQVMAGAAVTWSSGDASVAAVDGSGLVTAAANGAATITATAGEASGKAVVTVMQSAGSVIVSPSADTVVLGGTLRLVAEAFDANGHLVEGAAFTWSSSDGSVATVDASGLVRGVGEGKATLTATAGSATGTAEITVTNPDRAALVALYHATDGPNWVNSDNWLTDAPLRDWYGVDTDASGRVVGLVLAGRWDADAQRLISHGLSGPIPPELGNLSELRRLVLDVNELTGPIPPELGNLINLTRLNLDDNDLSGPIPAELGSPANLTILGLGDNDLSGPIPPQLGKLTSLTRLHLRLNNLKGPIPPELGNLANLEVLDLRWNDLAGPIPPELGDLANLWSLDLASNDLSGPIPPELGELANMTVLEVGWNELSGPLPHSFLQLQRLRVLAIAPNDLCVPAVSSFDEWVKRIETHDLEQVSYCNASDIAVLKALYGATGGTGWTNSSGWLGNGHLSEWHGVTADSLGQVAQLDLEGNGLDGQLPSDLGDLTGMTVLRIGRNALSGPLPASMTQVPLRVFHYAETDLCAPSQQLFQAWLNGISSHEGTGVNCAPLSDRDILETLYEATGGANWTNNANWLTDAPLGEWYGVSVDGEGRVVRLAIVQNNLSARIPPELGNLANLTELSLWGNNLSGPIPPELGNLANLTELSLWGNNLSGPIPPELGNLANLTELSLWGNNLSGPIPPELGNLASLTELSLWGNNLSGPIPPELGNLANLTELSLWGNNLSGPIPPELGNLANLTELSLWGNNLSGPIPPELGNLANLTRLDLTLGGVTGIVPPELGDLASLEVLSLGGNALEGAIPAELGNLAGLTEMHLWGNNLSGPIPPELGSLSSLTTLDLTQNTLTERIPPEIGNLSNLKEMRLGNNSLSGPIPPKLGSLSNLTTLDLTQNILAERIPLALGNLSSLRELRLGGNDLSGSIPSELGNLSTLEQLFLNDNELSGPVGPEFGKMSSLRELVLSNNSAMTGPLPVDLTALHRLEQLLAGGTDLCAPSDPGFQAWLEDIPKRRIAPCLAGDPPMAYLTQAVQSRKFPVPLVAGERALLRVFVTAVTASSEGIPLVRARFYLGGRETHVVDIPGKSAPIPTEVDESSLSKSANTEIPAEVIQPGLEMVMDVDPDGTLDPALGVPKRIPDSGRMGVDVRAVPLLDLTLIPFIWNETRDSSIVDVVEDWAADPENHEMFWHTLTLLPVADMEVTPHDPVVTSHNNVFALLGETAAIRALEGAAGYYMGLITSPVTGAAGAGFLPGRSSVLSPPSIAPSSVAHELGHNLSLPHAPCAGAANPDPLFPYPDGSIGAWGYDFRDGGRLVRPTTWDLMGYCWPRWISDYNFTNALRFRLSDADSAGLPVPPPAPAAARSLLLWGGVSADSVPFLEPAFVVDAPAELPGSGMEYRLTGRTESGAELFSLSFDMPEVADRDGSSSFAFVLPARPGWEGTLASITLAGPGGSFTLDGDSDLPMAILRNPRNGQVRGILRDLPPATQAARDAASAAGPGLEVLFSRGIPHAAAWRR